MKNGPIGVFDSGLGGLAVARQVMDLMPEEDIVYFSDFKNLPYGPRPQSEVRDFTLNIVRFLLGRGAKTVIIGCNTASAAGAAAADQASGEVRVIGMIQPAVKAALALGGLKKVGVAATKGTISSGEYEKAFAQADPAVQVFGAACPTILRLAEQGDIFDEEKILNLAVECTAPLTAQDVQAVILGCTDFTCIAPLMRKALPPETEMIDPAVESVRLADEFLRKKGWRRESGSGSIQYFAGGPGPKGAEDFARKIFDLDYSRVKIVDPHQG